MVIGDTTVGTGRRREWGSEPGGRGFVGSTPPMEADHPPPESAPPLAVADPGEPGEGSAVPSVVAVVVARGEAPHLEACLAGLRDSDYPDLTVLVMVPAGSDLRAR